MGQEALGPIIALATTLLTLVSGGYALMFRELMKAQTERARRAEEQVDTLVPTVQELSRTMLAFIEEYRRERDRGSR